MQFDHQLYRLGIFGISGSGKSTFATRFISGYRANIKFLFDHEGEWRKRFPRIPVVTRGAYLDRALPLGWVIYDPSADYGTDMEQAFRFFLKWIFVLSERIGGTKLLAVDEMQEFVDAHNCPDELAALVRLGRKRGIDSVFISNQPNSLPNCIRGNFSEMVCFQLTAEPSLEMVKKEFRFNPEEIATLAPLHYVGRTIQGAEYRGKIEIPR